MESEEELETGPDIQFCPECGAEESGYFCRGCGTLLRGEDWVLCPRCHHVVPDGDFCNQCGQGLGPIALKLRQLALAGEDFWVTAASLASLEQPQENRDAGLREPDESVILAEADLPDWLNDLPLESAPAEVKAHIYPALRPIDEEPEAAPRRFWGLAIVFLGLILLSLVVVAIVLLSRGFG